VASLSNLKLIKDFEMCNESGLSAISIENRIARNMNLAKIMKPEDCILLGCCSV
jgi:hypothetical protein